MGARAAPGQTFLLIGSLGAGKTCLTQGVLWGLGGDEYARSPTFVMVAEYRANMPLYHIDLYRADAVSDIIDLGLDEYIYGDGLCVVEWADRAMEVFPADRLEVHIDHIDDRTRRLELRATGPAYERLLEGVEALAAGAQT